MRSQALKQERPREEGAKEMSGEERLPEEQWRRVGMSGSLRSRRSEGMTSNTYPMSPRGGDGGRSLSEEEFFEEG